MRVLTLGLACAALLAAAPNSTPTFYKDVLPVLQRNCQNCHRPGEAGPMSFLSYESTRPWAKAIKAAVATKKMPPWFADPRYGHFENDRRLSEAEFNTLISWVDTGATAGNPKDAPKPVTFVEGWNIGKPDMVFKMPTAFHIPESGVVDYHYVILPTNFTEDKYVQFAESRPSDREHTHHVVSFVRAGQCILIKAGSDIVLQLHYTTNGKAGDDKSEVGLVFAKEKPTARLVGLAATTSKFAIPPNDPNYEVAAKVTLQRDSTLMSFFPHMHLRGKDMTMIATFPDGRQETLLSVPHYSFEWQLSYYLEKPLLLPKGTTMEAVAHFDNSANNPSNPDPTKEVRFGEQGWDEMMFGFFIVAVPPEVTVMDLVRPPKPQPKATGADQR